MQFLFIFMCDVKYRREEINVCEMLTVDQVLDRYFLIDLPNNSLMKRFYHFTKEETKVWEG